MRKKTSHVKRSRITLIGPTWLFQFVGHNAANEVRLSCLQAGHQLVQRFLQTFVTGVIITTLRCMQRKIIAEVDLTAIIKHSVFLNLILFVLLLVCSDVFQINENQR